MSHTKGPWTFDGPNDNAIVWSGPKDRICFMSIGPQTIANARLISAAPDLLAVAIWAEAALAPFSKEPAEKSGIANLRAAIAKATQS